MMARSHVLIGVGTWAVLAPGMHLAAPETVGYALAAGGALLPDIDHPQSAVGRRLPFLSKPISAVFGHRGITHSLLAIVAGLMVLIWWGKGGIAAPLVVGYLSHLAADSMTPSGVPLLWPWRQRFGLGLVKTGSWSEIAFLFACGAIVAWLQVPGAEAWIRKGAHAISRLGS